MAKEPDNLPATLVFDLDLSATGGDADGQKALDAELKKLVEGGEPIKMSLPPQVQVYKI
jgi:hypothetical protein